MHVRISYIGLNFTTLIRISIPLICNITELNNYTPTINSYIYVHVHLVHYYKTSLLKLCYCCTIQTAITMVA